MAAAREAAEVSIGGGAGVAQYVLTLFSLLDPAPGGREQE